MTSRCEKDCTRKRPDCDHPCPRRCFQDCGRCEVLVPKVVLPGCAHEATLPCWQTRKLSRELCEVPVAQQMACGHVIRVPCGQQSQYDSDVTRCTARCDRLLP